MRKKERGEKSKHDKEERRGRMTRGMRRGRGGGPSKNVEAKTSTGHGDDETTDIAKVSNMAGAHQGEQDEVALRSLKSIHSLDLLMLNKIKSKQQ